MKKLRFLLPALLFLAACANDFEVTAPWKEVPVVYAILSPKDTAHYVRVEKAFLDPEKSALEIAQIADSLYYPDNAIAVFLEQKSNQQRFQLQRVDGALEGYDREDGIFATQPNWLYKTKETLLPGETYGLVIERNDGKPDVTAETTLPKDFQVVKPIPATPTLINFFGHSTTDIEWRTDANGLYFNITFRVRYHEEAPDGTILYRDTLVWEAAKNVKRDDQSVGQNLFRGTADISGAAFYKFLQDNIPPCSNCFRYFDGLDMTLEGGGKEIEAYLEVAAANSGLTGAEVFPVYTNIFDGFGLFTGKNSINLNAIRVRPATVDSMNAYGPAIQALKFTY